MTASDPAHRSNAHGSNVVELSAFRAARLPSASLPAGVVPSPYIGQMYAPMYPVIIWVPVWFHAGTAPKSGQQDG